MEHKPRWAEMCAQILKQCETVRGGRESLASEVARRIHLRSQEMLGRALDRFLLLLVRR